jgi:glycosyltransferase involved in cell wall biosynthesis
MNSISIIIPFSKSFSNLRRLIASIQSQKYENKEIIIASLTSEKEILESLSPDIQMQGKIHIVTPARAGANGARNAGIKQAKNDILLLIDDDCELISSNFLQTIVNLHEQYPQATAIGGIYKASPDAQPADLAYNILSYDWQHCSNGKQVNPSSRLVGGNVSYKRQKLPEERLFLQDIEYGAAESEFHQYLEASGHQLLVDESLEVFHYPDITIKDLRKKAKAQATNAIKFEIDSGYREEEARTYHSFRSVLCYQLCPTPKHKRMTEFFINLYDRNFLRHSSTMHKKKPTAIFDILDYARYALEKMAKDDSRYLVKNQKR